MKDPFKPLDKYEKELIDSIDKDEWVPVPNQKKELERISSYFKSMPKKDKRITIRVNQRDLIKIQKKAIETGIPYQTLISAILRQYASGRVDLNL